MNKAIHAAVLAAFGIACWFLWGMLTLGGSVIPRLLPDHTAPGFTRLCFQFTPLLLVLPCLAAAYCVVVWCRRSKSGDTWFGFFATTMTTTLLLALPTIIAVILPLVSVLERQAK